MAMTPEATTITPAVERPEPSPPKPVSQSFHRFAWVDLLRGLSALGVVFFHSRVDLYAGWNEIHAHPGAYSAIDRTGAYLSLPMAFMGSGVMLFFILSGFCVHYPYAGGRKAFQGGGYSARRFLRIYPPYLVAILVTIMLEWAAAALHGPASSDSGTTVNSILMVQNYGPHAGQMAGNPSLWSLPVEMELYVAYPVFLWVLARFGVRWSLLLVAAVSGAACFAMRWGGTFPSGGFLPFWIIWCIGAALAEVVVVRKALRWTPWLWVVAGVCLSGAIYSALKVGHPMVKQYWWTGFYLCVLLFGLTSTRAKEWLTGKAGKGLAGFGAITYSLYLIHFPLLRLMGAAWTEMAGAKPGNLFVPICGSLLCVPAAYGFYRLVERPGHEIARRIGKRLEGA